MGDFFSFAGAPRLKWSRGAFFTSVATSILFLAVYNLCNYITSLRTDVSVWVFEWERQIPFVPLMVIPYMSIDLFFVAAPFMLGEERDLLVFRRRIAAAILSAGACFLLFPMRLAFERPHAEGLLGAVFNPFVAVDKPFNLLPSLHIALRTILADAYARHTKGIWRFSSHVWFSLVGFSTILTKQHHLVDVAGGFILAIIVFHLIGNEPVKTYVKPNRRVGAYYAAGAFSLLLASWIMRPAGVFLLWPAASLATVAAGYYWLGPGIFRKRNGKITALSWLAMWPVLAGQWLSLKWYSLRCKAWDEVVPGLIIGRMLSGKEAEKAIGEGVRAVLDLTGEFSESTPFLDLEYLNVQVLDLTAPSQGQIEGAVSFISLNLPRGKVYVHCKIGYSRSAAVVGAWLLRNGRAKDAEDAMKLMRDARPSIVIRPEIVELLQNFTR